MIPSDQMLAFQDASSVADVRRPRISRTETTVHGRFVEAPSRIDRWLLRRILKHLGQPPVRIVLWNGEEFGTSEEPLVGRIILHTRAALRRLFRQPRIEFGETYRDGSLDVEGDLPRVLATLYGAVARMSSRGWIGRLLSLGEVRHRSHSVGHSRDNVHHHYDIGNDFYRLWLDDQLLYTCAYFVNANDTLEQAQVAKMDHVCRKLRLNSGDLVAEAGCGWGALALHMARRYGAKVRAFNLSHEQITYARQRARKEGLADRVEFVEDDYRNMTGQYDAFVSVGMLEHVGLANYRLLGQIIDRALTPTGRGLIHTIGRNVARPLDPWIAKRIFPGAYPPSLREMMDIFEPAGLSVLDVENLRLHYARTLAHWLERYERNADAITSMFDAEFYRTWRLYLAGSEATFLTGELQLFQVVFARATDNSIPWTRAHIYQ